MRRFLVLLYVCVILAAGAVPAWATNFGNKLARGIINVPTSIIEIPGAYSRSKERLEDYGKEHPEEFLTPTLNTPYQYLVNAPLNGIVKMLRRLCVGCYDIVTFPFSLPRYYAPVYEPEFVFDTMPYVYKIQEQGEVYMGRGNYRGAIRRFTQVLKLDPVNARALYQRGRAYDIIGRFRESADDLHAAESLGYHPELEHVASPDDL